MEDNIMPIQQGFYDPNELFTIKETLATLKISRGTLYLLIRNNKITPNKYGGRTMFLRSEIERYKLAGSIIEKKRLIAS